jgi:calcium-dependent protein kinase
MMKRLRHPCIVRYESLFIDMKKRLAWLVMEHMNYPSLEKASIRSEDDMKKIMFQLMETLNYIHRHDTVHRDIKLSNILYDAGSKTIKVVDFGISKRFRKRDALVDMWTVTGTLYYRAPEMFGGDGYR